MSRKTIITSVLSDYPLARKIAVENFLGTCPMETSQDKAYAKMNLEMDAKLYRWDRTTVSAIMVGIHRLATAAGL